MNNGYKQYVKSREAASEESIRRSKSMNQTVFQIHPIFSKYFSKFTRNKNNKTSYLLRLNEINLICFLRIKIKELSKLKKKKI